VRTTTTISVYRGTTTNDYEDVVALNDETTLVASGVLASIIEQSRRVFTPVSDPAMDTRVVRYCTGRIRTGVDLRNDDRVKDERTGTIYIVEGMRQPSSPVRTNEIVFDMKVIAS